MKYNNFIDHTLLRADATTKEITQLCAEARQYKFASVCVNPSFIPLCKTLLAGSGVKVCTVIGFPLGAMTTEAKVFETKNAIEIGAEEVDMVVNITQLKEGNLKYVTKEIAEIKKACQDVCLKVIVETCLLSTQQKIDACKCVSDAKADFIKTSTGFSTAGATVEDVEIFKKHVSPEVKIKAAGGVRSFADLEMMINAGADRIGTSRGVELMKQ